MKDRPEASSTWDGRDLKAMFAAATALLEANASQINALNVFPVPDGDTGTNLLFTMRSSMESANKSPGESAAAVAQAMAQGALMGARGNSGVILSQILRGIAKSLDGRSSFGSRELVVAFSEASAAAYRAVSRPVEGTILTVIREAAAAAEARAATDGDDIVAIWGVATVAAREAVAKTPSLLPVLREAGVVDAGGLGLYILMDGAWRHMRGERVTEFAQATAGPWRLAEGSEFSTFEDEEPYGYCTEFLLYGSDLKSEEFRDKIATMGQSVIVVGDEVLLRVHIHALDPGAVLSYATSLGTILQVKVENMEDQHVDFLAMQPDKALVVGDIAIVAVVSGEGLANVFRSLGTAAIVPGGSSMNPSTQELLQAIESVSVDKVI
ncbi:MAG: DAK2 domain-containing protein, partial [Chloroflexi bacterium]|nr:DAK2 domain-containing protein [Chloroflexota bacterium]